MPNYCFNELKVEGKKTELKRFLNDIVQKCQADKDHFFHDKYELTMTNIVPPDEYNSPSSLWGTKWDFFDVNTSVEDIVNQIHEEGIIHICYSTAWGPNDLFFTNIYKKYDLSFDLLYYEPGCELLGASYFYNNNETNECYDDFFKFDDLRSLEAVDFMIEHDLESMEYIIEYYVSSFDEEAITIFLNKYKSLIDSFIVEAVNDMDIDSFVSIEIFKKFVEENKII